MNKLRILTTAFLATLGVATLGNAQVAQQPVAVQQPVFQFFSTNTTVTVPDGGAALLGGVDSARFGSTSRGVPMLGKLPGAGRLFRNRAFGSEVNSSRNYVRAQIIDLQEMDEAILGSSASSSAGYPGITQRPNDATQNAARFLTQNVGRRGDAKRAARDARPIEPAAPVSRARALLAKGDQALADGKIELATQYFREAERIANKPAYETAVRPADRRTASGEAEQALVLGDER